MFLNHRHVPVVCDGGTEAGEDPHPGDVATEDLQRLEAAPTLPPSTGSRDLHRPILPRLRGKAWNGNKGGSVQ